MFVACSFGTYETVVPWARMPYAATRVLTVSADSTTLWAVNIVDPSTGEGPRLKVFDADNGALIASSWWGGSWGVRALAPANEPGYEDVAWVLHDNGYRIRWNSTLVGYSEIEVPIPLTGATAADHRGYCDMDHDLGGVQFLTTIDMVGGADIQYLYREPSEAVWERVSVGAAGGKCPWVSVDGPADRVAVIIDDSDLIQLFDADDLTPEGTIDISGVPGDLKDFAMIGNHAVLAMNNGGGAYDSLVIVDDDGVVLDTTDLAAIAATYIHIGDDEARAFWTGADSGSAPKYAAGWFSLVDD